SSSARARRWRAWSAPRTRPPSATRSRRSTPHHKETRMWFTKQLVLHGGIVLLIGLLCGAPLGSAVVRGKGEEAVRAWRVAHTSLVTGGILLLAVAAIAADLK